MPFMRLPPELVLRTWNLLPSPEFCAAAGICRALRQIAMDCDEFWSSRRFQRTLQVEAFSQAAATRAAAVFDQCRLAAWEIHIRVPDAHYLDEDVMLVMSTISAACIYAKEVTFDLHNMRAEVVVQLLSTFAQSASRLRRLWIYEIDCSQFDPRTLQRFGIYPRLTTLLLDFVPGHDTSLLDFLSHAKPAFIGHTLRHLMVESDLSNTLTGIVATSKLPDANPCVLSLCSLNWDVITQAVTTLGLRSLHRVDGARAEQGFLDVAWFLPPEPCILGVTMLEGLLEVEAFTLDGDVDNLRRNARADSVADTYVKCYEALPTQYRRLSHASTTFSWGFVGSHERVVALQIDAELWPPGSTTMPGLLSLCVTWVGSLDVQHIALPHYGTLVCPRLKSLALQSSGLREVDDVPEAPKTIVAWPFIDHLVVSRLAFTATTIKLFLLHNLHVELDADSIHNTAWLHSIQNSQDSAPASADSWLRLCEEFITV